MSRPAAFSGAVLAGGASRRMGVDKAMLVLDGRPLVVRVADALTAAGAAEVLVVGGDRRAIERLGLNYVPDRAPGSGPLGGLVTAMEAAPSAVVVVLATDLVHPDADAIARLVDTLDATPACDAAVPIVGGRRQWLHAAWRRAGRAALDDAFVAGERAIHRAVAASSLRVANVPGLPPRAMADADRPDQVPSR
ncbi:MAG: molybdenum cofactor guanylyltransferase [Acidimicrobiales bacterium]